MSATESTGRKLYDPTDTVCLLIDNDADQHARALDMARASILNAPACDEVKSETWSVHDAERFHLADALKDWLEDELEACEGPRRRFGPNLAASLAAESLNYCDFHEAADHYLTKVRESNRTR